MSEHPDIPSTHIVTTPNKKPQELTPLELVKYNLNTKYLKEVTNFFEGDKYAAMRFMTASIDYIRRVPKLVEANPVSLVNALMTIASFRFIPSSVAGEAYIISYAGEATFQIGYKGYVTLLYRAGMKKIDADIIREHDIYSMTDGELHHTVDLTKSVEQRGKPIGAYIRAMLPSGETVTKYMNATDILAHGKRFSKSFEKPDSPWNPKNDPELNIWKKTVLIQASKFLPKNNELNRAMEEDFKDSNVSTGIILDAAGPATAPALHEVSKAE